jgi:hypothetical protein
MNSLFALEIGVKNGKVDRLDGGTEALYLVLRYFNSDPETVRLLLTKSLASIAHALHDTSQGAKPSLIFERSATKNRGAPARLAKAGLRAQVNLLFEMLIRAKIPRTDAAKWLAAELGKAGVLNSGKPIKAPQIDRWSRERDGKSLSGSDATYRKLAAGQERRGWPSQPQEARARVRRLIGTLRAAGF